MKRKKKCSYYPHRFSLRSDNVIEQQTQDYLVYLRTVGKDRAWLRRVVIEAAQREIEQGQSQ